MIWHKHLNHDKNTHAFCSASKYSWRNWDVDKLLQMKAASYAAAIGTAVHEYAEGNIAKKIRIQKGDKHGVLRHLVVEKKIPERAINIDYIFPTLMMYVNDCIGYRLDPEVYLEFSDDFSGTADALQYENRVLQVSDLKTGVRPASFEQLENYASLFCLEYKVNPKDIQKIIFRIYQAGEIQVAEPDPSVIMDVMERMKRTNSVLEKWY